MSTITAEAACYSCETTNDVEGDYSLESETLLWQCDRCGSTNQIRFIIESDPDEIHEERMLERYFTD